MVLKTEALNTAWSIWVRWFDRWWDRTETMVCVSRVWDWNLVSFVLEKLCTTVVHSVYEKCKSSSDGPLRPIKQEHEGSMLHASYFIFIQWMSLFPHSPPPFTTHTTQYLLLFNFLLLFCFYLLIFYSTSIHPFFYPNLPSFLSTNVNTDIPCSCNFFISFLSFQSQFLLFTWYSI